MADEHPRMTITLSYKDYHAVMHMLGDGEFTFRDGAHIQPVEPTKDVCVELREVAEKAARILINPLSNNKSTYEREAKLIASYFRPLIQKRDAELIKLRLLSAQAVEKIGDLELQLATTRKDLEQLAKHMTWVLDRLVNLYRESEHTDYIIVGRRLVDTARAAEEKS